jgi:hypothetical protein
LSDNFLPDVEDVVVIVVVVMLEIVAFVPIKHEIVQFYYT